MTRGELSRRLSRAGAVGGALLLAGLRGFSFAEAPRSENGPPRDLSPGKRVEAELRSGEEHRYRVSLHSDRCVRILAEQIGIDVKLALSVASGAEPGAQVDERSSGNELLLFNAPHGGMYELRVSAAGERPPPGRYALLVDEAAADAARRSAFARHIEARALAARGMEHQRDARTEFEAARGAWEALGERAMEAYSLFEIGRISKRLTELDASKTAFAESARRFADLGQIADQAAAQNGLGETLVAVGDYRAACALWKSTFPLEESLSPADRVLLRYNYGSTVKELGDFQTLLEAVRHAIEAFHDLGMTASELNARAELASTYIMQRDPVRALEELNRGVALSREAARPDMEARFLQRLGLVYWDAGDADTAAEQWRRALTLHRDAGNRIGEAAVLLQLGDCSAAQRELTEASATYQQALDIFLSAGSKLGEARALTRLGTILTKRGEFARAAELHRKALEIDRAQGARQSEVSALVNLARAKSGAGERAEARRFLTSALSLTRASGAGFGEQEILGELALIDRDEGATTRALATLETVLGKVETEQRAALVPSLQATLGSEAQVWYAARTDILMGLHLSASRGGWDAKGLESAERARARALLGLLAESRADIRKGVEPALLERYRALQVDLSAADRARGGPSGASTGASTTAPAGAPTGASAAASTGAPASASASASTGASTGASTPASTGAPTGAPTSSSASAGAGRGATEIEREIADLTSKLQLVESKIRRSSPAYAALTQPIPLGVDAIRKRVLDEDTVLIEYALGAKRSWLWAVTKDTLLSAPLPPGEEIEAAAQKLYRRLSARPSADAANGAEEEAAALSRILLEPIAARLSGAWRGRRLAIVPAGALAYIPFGVLPVPDADPHSLPVHGPHSGPARRLIDDHEIVSLPSASVLDLMRNEIAGRTPASMKLALLGDPVFGADDPRVRGATSAPVVTAAATPHTRSDDAAPGVAEPEAQPGTISRTPLAADGSALPRSDRTDRGAVDPRATAPPGTGLPYARPGGADSAIQSASATPPLTTTPSDPAAPPVHEAPPDPVSRAALVAGGTHGFPRLPFSRDEVQAIAALLPEEEVFKATDFRASRALVTDGTLGRYRILHIATHGLLNTAHPELSGLVLSLVDEDGHDQDGFLRLQDVYNLHLSADLVVLSACRTALGRQISGEGLVGLTRGFMYAGVPRVLASLWQVDDSATAELMTEFYRGIFQEGLRPAAALRGAQRKLARDPRRAAPFFWAGFTLEGDWR